MNIFALNESPVLAARDLCDRHLIKMQLESAQLFCTVAYIRGITVPGKLYAATHLNHPCTHWLNESISNIMWLHEHLIEMNAEYLKRKLSALPHASYFVGHRVALHLRNLDPFTHWDRHTPFARAMPTYLAQQFRDPTAAYKLWYAWKSLNAFEMSWKNSKQPSWLPSYRQQAAKLPNHLNSLKAYKGEPL